MAVTGCEPGEAAHLRVLVAVSQNQCLLHSMSSLANCEELDGGQSRLAIIRR